MAADPVDDDRPWRRFLCRACGYVYDERDGDPDGGLAPGTRFEDIPDDWACPLCGVSKADFDPYVDPPDPTTAKREPVTVWRAVRRGVVIVGGGQAAWSTARAIRVRDPAIPITMVSADAADVYSKPSLSLAFGHRRRSTDLVAASGRDAARELGIRLVPFAAAVAIDAPRKRVRTTRGAFPYETLVLATGARPLEAPSMPSAFCWRINSLDAWTRLEAVLQHGPARVVVIGAGLVGCELADDLAHAGHAVTVLDPATRPLAAWASDVEADRLLDGWRALGVAFHGNAVIASVTREEQGRGGRPAHRVRCADGRSYDAEVVIAAIGLSLDPRLSASAGLAADRGIAVDATRYTTSDPSIYATGDCISIDGRPCRFIEPLARQADTIARSIVDDEASTATHRPPLVRLKTRSAAMTLSGR